MTYKMTRYDARRHKTLRVQELDRCNYFSDAGFGSLRIVFSLSFDCLAATEFCEPGVQVSGPVSLSP